MRERIYGDNEHSVLNDIYRFAWRLCSFVHLYSIDIKLQALFKYRISYTEISLRKTPFQLRRIETCIGRASQRVFTPATKYQHWHVVTRDVTKQIWIANYGETNARYILLRLSQNLAASASSELWSRERHAYDVTRCSKMSPRAEWRYSQTEQSDRTDVGYAREATCDEHLKATRHCGDGQSERAIPTGTCWIRECKTTQILHSLLEGIRRNSKLIPLQANDFSNSKKSYARSNFEALNVFKTTFIGHWNIDDFEDLWRGQGKMYMLLHDHKYLKYF